MFLVPSTLLLFKDGPCLHHTCDIGNNDNTLIISPILLLKCQHHVKALHFFFFFPISFLNLFYSSVAEDEKKLPAYNFLLFNFLFWHLLSQSGILKPFSGLCNLHSIWLSLIQNGHLFIQNDPLHVCQYWIEKTRATAKVFRLCCIHLLCKPDCIFGTPSTRFPHHLSFHPPFLSHVSAFFFLLLSSCHTSILYTIYSIRL